MKLPIFPRLRKIKIKIPDSLFFQTLKSWNHRLKSRVRMRRTQVYLCRAWLSFSSRLPSSHSWPSVLGGWSSTTLNVVDSETCGKGSRYVNVVLFCEISIIIELSIVSEILIMQIEILIVIELSNRMVLSC